MGNVQASSIANQLLPFEIYIGDVAELKYLHSLGSTRFMKVAHAEHSDGPLVVKIFVFIDPSFYSLSEQYKQKINLIGRQLLNHPNCCPFTRIYTTSRCAVLCRPFKKFTLYDRLSTRPFLQLVEKKWIAFQLLKALAQLRIAMVRHGDIKSQNVLVMTNLWVQLSDFAPFKPAFLPSDDPTDFTYFFDTSRKRFCYLAPERFKSTEELNYSVRLPGDYLNISDGLTEEMDIFSIGCVLVELLTDGRYIPFNLSQSIDYKRMDEQSARHFLRQTISNTPEEFHELLFVMLDRNPIRRKENYAKLSPCSSTRLFPPLFEKYLYRYFKEFQFLVSPDDILTKLYAERDNYFAQLVDDNSSSVILFIDIITPAIRGCRSLTPKMDSISLLQQLSRLAPSTIVLDRIVPYLTYLLYDSFPQVRSEAIFVLTEMLTSLDSIPRDESRLLIDYIFPRMKSLSVDSSTLVKMSMAINLGKLALLSKRFFDANNPNFNDSASDPNSTFSSTENRENSLCVEESSAEEEHLMLIAEKQALIESVNDLFITCCGSENPVRRCLFEPSNLDLLCQFFGSKRATDILLHMITLLNDKNDWRIRATFFKSCPVIAKHLGPGKTSDIKPFLQQGLQDHEEFVILQTFDCIYLLCQEKLLNKPTICEIMDDMAPFLIHSNKLLRIAVINILAQLDSNFSIAETYCKILPRVKQFLKENLLRLNDKEVIYESLREPIALNIWDFVLKFAHSSDLISALENKRILDKLGGGKNSLFSVASSSSLPTTTSSLSDHSTDDCNMQVESALRKLRNIGMNEHVEEKLLEFKNFIYKNSSHYKISKKRNNCGFELIALNQLKNARRRLFDLETGILRLSNSTSSRHDDLIIQTGLSMLSNQFATGLRGNPRLFNCSSSDQLLLEDLLQHKQQLYREQKRITMNSGAIKDAIGPQLYARMGGENSSSHPPISGAVHKPMTQNSLPVFQPGRRKPVIRLLAHLHEHSSKVTRLAMHPDKDHFASSSRDKSVKIWCSSSLEDNTQPPMISKETFTYAHGINSCGFLCHSSDHLVMACADASVQIFDIERRRLLKSHQVDVSLDGNITALYCYEHLIYVLTHHSSIFCFDLRVSSKSSRNTIELSPIWKRRSKNSYGLITSFCIDPCNEHWMFLTGSSATTKNMVLWDLRFGGLEVVTWSHPSDKIIPLRCWPLVLDGSRSQHVFTNSSREGEISLWDLSTHSQTDIFWPSPERPFSYKREIVSTALTSLVTDSNIAFVGDSEGSLRCWNLKSSEGCSYLCGPYHPLYNSALSSVDDLPTKYNPSAFNYQRFMSKDSLTRVFVEQRPENSSSSSSSPSLVPCPSNLQVNECHVDGITDLISVWPDYIASSSIDGTIKLWKIS